MQHNVTQYSVYVHSQISHFHFSDKEHVNVSMYLNCASPSARACWQQTTGTDKDTTHTWTDGQIVHRMTWYNTQLQ